MQWTLHVLVSLLCIAGRAERPSRHDGVLAADRTGILDEDEAQRCPQEEPLRAVLTSLGFNTSGVDLRHFPGVLWSRCVVIRIDFRGRRDLGGSLSPEIRKLAKLQALILRYNVTGVLEALAKNTKLMRLQLQNTRISGSLEGLAKAKDLEWLDLRNTEVVGDLKSLAELKKLQELTLANTRVSGDLKSLAELKKLQVLTLANTGVFGDLKSLAELKKLQELTLANTGMFGDLKSLAELKKLQELKLANSQVVGDVAVMGHWPEIRVLDLSATKVDGHITQNSSSLESLNVAKTKVDFLKSDFLQHWSAFRRHWYCPFPALRALDLSGAPQHGQLRHLLRPFSGCQALNILKAAGCGLTGPFRFIRPWPLSRALGVLDLAANNVTKVQQLPGSCRTLVLTGNPGVSFWKGVLQKAINEIVFVDLRNTTFANANEATDLLDAGVVTPNFIARTVFDQTHGFACYDLQSTSLQVSPEKFAADRLCDCSPGWKGSGAKCKKCPKDTFKDDFSAKDCKKCPDGSKAPEGSTSQSSCVCDVGVLDNSSGSWKCGCPKEEAKSSDVCVKCPKLFLNCSTHGSELQSARPLPNYTRVGNESRAYRCLMPASRCNAKQKSDSAAPGYNASTTCAEGYTDPMCVECAPDYFSTGKQCEHCHTTDLLSSGALMLVAGLFAALAAVGAGWFLWTQRANAEAQVPTNPTPWNALMQQAKAQVPILLQMCQLWTVLAVLASKMGPDDREDAGMASSYWEVPYIQTLQMSISTLKDTVNLQCKFEGAWIRFGSALASPVLPLIVLLFCLVPELVKPGSGIAAGLQVVTLLYIGGASSTSGLLSCQETDGAGDSLPKEVVYRKLMPYILCHEDSQLKHQVDAVAFACAGFYGIIIPCCLLYMYGKQHLVLEVNRTRMVVAGYQGDLSLCLHEVLGSTTQKISGKDQEITRPLVAAAAAYISVLYRGRVQLQIVDGTAIVKQLGHSDEANDLQELDLLTFIRAEDAKERAKQLKCRSIAEMLTERVILQDVSASDRVLAGAQNLLQKYALCRNIWMEIAQKLVAVALVSAVSSTNGFEWCFAVTLIMAATSTMVQPYAQPQVNTLHSCSFLCLALSATSFAYRWVWPGRVALAIPFLLSAAQALRPDSPESLSVRLWQELERHMAALQCGELVEVTAEIHSFISPGRC